MQKKDVLVSGYKGLQDFYVNLIYDETVVTTPQMQLSVVKAFLDRLVLFGKIPYYEYNSITGNATVITEKLEKLKEEKIEQVQALYTQYQVVKLVDSIIIYFPLKGIFYELLKDRKTTARDDGFCSLAIVDLNGNAYQARDDLSCKRVPYIFINELFCKLNKISETNKLKKDYLIGNEDYQTLGLVQNATSIENLNAININIFDICPDVNLDLIIDEFYTKTDAEIQTLGYSQYHINNFRTWKENLIINSDNKYQIFEKINI